MRKKNSNSSQSFLQGAVILAISVMIVKVIGVVFKVPIGNILGGTGYGYFTAAYDLYGPLETLATAGFPIAISKMVSENMAKGRYRDVRFIHKLSTPLFLITGTIGTIAMVLISFVYVNASASPGGLFSCIALAPTVLFVCLMSIYRGYYQGLRNMYPTAISEVIEAFVKLIVGLAASYLIVIYGTKVLCIPKEETLPYASAAAILGVVIGAACGFLYLFFRYKKHGDGITVEQLKSSPKSYGTKKTMKTLVSIAIPIGMAAIVMNLATLADSVIVRRRIADLMSGDQSAHVLLSMYGDNIPSIEVANSTVNSYLYGCFGFISAITMIIPAVTQMFGVSALPNVTTAWVKKDKKLLKKSIESVLRITSMVSIPSGIILVILGDPIVHLFFGGRPKEVNIAVNVIVIMAIAMIFMSICTPVFSMLQAVGKSSLPVKLLSIGVIMKVILNYILVGIPEINIKGAGVGTFVCYLFVLITSLYYLFNHTKVIPNFVTIFIKPFLSSIISSIIGFLSYNFISKLIDFRISVLISLIIFMIFYVFSLFLFKGIKKSDIIMFPKGEKLVKALEKRKLIR